MRTSMLLLAGAPDLGDLLLASSGEDPVIHNQVGFQSSPAVVDGTLYVGCRDAHVYALDAATGRKKWDYPTSKSWVIGTPAVRAGLVYAAIAGDLVYFGDHNGRLYAIDSKTGKLGWEFQTEASKTDPMKVLHPDGSLNQGGFAPVLGDFEDMYLDTFRFTRIGSIPPGACGPAFAIDGHRSGHCGSSGRAGSGAETAGRRS